MVNSSIVRYYFILLICIGIVSFCISTKDSSLTQEDTYFNLEIKSLKSNMGIDFDLIEASTKQCNSQDYLLLLKASIMATAIFCL